MAAMLAANSLKQNIVDNIRFDCNFASPGSIPPGGRNAPAPIRPPLPGHLQGLSQQGPSLADFQPSITTADSLSHPMPYNPTGTIPNSNYNRLHSSLNAIQHIPSSANPLQNLPHSAHENMPSVASNLNSPYL